MSLEYIKSKQELSYELFLKNKFYKKARAIVVKNGKLFVIKITYNDGRKTHYLVPGGGVDEGETIKQAVVRETLEEYDVHVRPVKYIGRQYYKSRDCFNDIKFISNRVEYYYICEYLADAKTNQFGEFGEFDSKEKTYEKVELSLDDVLKINPYDLNNMNQEIYDKVIEYMKGK